MDRLVSGTAELTPEGWLHIRLDTLLPHCRYGSTSQITGTIHTLLDDLGEQLPYFREAFMFIEEHSDDDTRRVYDQDNKGWKSVSNALKGRVFPDDDQYTLSIGLLTRRSPEAVCHIYVMPPEASSAYLEMRFNACFCTPSVIFPRLCL